MGPDWRTGLRSQGWGKEKPDTLRKEAPLQAVSVIGILDLEVPREVIEVADVPEDHVSIAAEVQRQ